MSTKEEIIASCVAAMKELNAQQAARDQLVKLKESMREKAAIHRKKAWHLSEIARIERGPETNSNLQQYSTAGYGGYLDGYRGGACSQSL